MSVCHGFSSISFLHKFMPVRDPSHGFGVGCVRLLSQTKKEKERGKRDRSHGPTGYMPSSCCILILFFVFLILIKF